MASRAACQPKEMAEDLGTTSEVAALQLGGITALGLAHEVGPGRYRCGGRAAGPG